MPVYVLTAGKSSLDGQISADAVEHFTEKSIVGRCDAINRGLTVINSSQVWRKSNCRCETISVCPEPTNAAKGGLGRHASY